MGVHWVGVRLFTDENVKCTYAWGSIALQLPSLTHVNHHTCMHGHIGYYSIVSRTGQRLGHNLVKVTSC